MALLGPSLFLFGGQNQQGMLDRLYRYETREHTDDRVYGHETEILFFYPSVYNPSINK
jgi:hypothetical protein